MPENLARYYDRNTARFLFVGPGRDTYSIHRELWGPGVTSASEAAAYIDGLMGDKIAKSNPDGPTAVVDFGCGVGGTLLSLAHRFPDMSLHGVTISKRQVDIARRLAERAGVSDRMNLKHADFHDVDLAVEADAVLAIESLAHSGDRAAFLATAKRHLRPCGRLLVADDFLATEAQRLSSAQRSCVERFRRGWMLPGLCTVDRLMDDAGRAGLSLREDVELTELARPGSRTRDRLVALVAPLADRCGLSPIPFFGNMIGGHALQVGLSEGFIRYRLLEFEATTSED